MLIIEIKLIPNAVFKALLNSKEVPTLAHWASLAASSETEKQIQRMRQRRMHRRKHEADRRRPSCYVEPPQRSHESVGGQRIDARVVAPLVQRGARLLHAHRSQRPVRRAVSAGGRGAPGAVDTLSG